MGLSAGCARLNGLCPCFIAYVETNQPALMLLVCAVHCGIAQAMIGIKSICAGSTAYSQRYISEVSVGLSVRVH